MMLQIRTAVVAMILAAISFAPTQEAQAGPLLDWLRGIRRPGLLTPNYAQPYSQPYGYYGGGQARNGALSRMGALSQTGAPNAAGLQPGQCMKTCNQTCNRTVVNYVPYTAYRTNWNKVPVTQYRPVTSTDPCTGCTMTCMKPCTTYTYQMQRVPYTTYRPVYRQEQYTVPVTTITNDCATGNCGTGNCSPANYGAGNCSTGNCGGCATCGTNTPPAFGGPAYGAPQNYAPTPANIPTYSAPSMGNGSLPAADTSPSISMPSGTSSQLSLPGGSIDTGNTYQVQTNAYKATQPVTPYTASAPDIHSATQGVRPQAKRRSFLDQIENHGTDVNRSDRHMTQADRRNDFTPKTKMQSLRRRWSYAPVRMASNDTGSNLNAVKFTSVKRSTPLNSQRINDAWEDVR